MSNFIVTVKFKIFPESLNEFIPLIIENARNSLFEDGCSVFDVSKRDNTIYLYEVYESEQAFKYHLDTDHFKNFDKTTSRMVEEKIAETYYQIEV